MLTWHNDNARTGQNLLETILTPANVRSTMFGKLAVLNLDGKVDAQALYVPALAIPSRGVHNVLYVATEHGSLYAFDADTFAQLWQKSLLGANETPSDDHACSQVTPEGGITATPVIDLQAGGNGMIYAIAQSRDANGQYHHRLHALDLPTLTEQLGGPVEIRANFPGSGVENTFVPAVHTERPGLLISNDVIYTSWGSHCDAGPYVGWVLSYSKTTLGQVGVLNLVPNGNRGGVWSAGSGPAADANGSIYLLTGNGTFDTTLNSFGFPSMGDFGNAFVKISASGGLSVTDYFTMVNTVSESAADVDLGSGGLMLLPPMDNGQGTGTLVSLVVGAGKDKNIYVLDQNNLGKFNPSMDSVYQLMPNALPGGSWSSPAWFNGKLYYGGVGDNLKAFAFGGGSFSLESHSPNTFPYPGTTPSISANGLSNGIVWAVENQGTAVLHAYDANNVATELYNSNQAAGGRDHFGSGNKFIVPTIANGKVYVGTTGGVGVFGVLPGNPTPSLSVTKTHTGNFTQGQQGATFMVTVSNAPSAAQTIGAVTVTETAPPGFTLVSMAGTGWTCPTAGTTCTRTDALAPGSSYLPIVVTVNVAANASSPQLNAVSVSGGGSASANATDSTSIIFNPVLRITKSHTGNFSQGQTNAIYTVTVSNANGAGSTSGAVTVTETVPAALNLLSMAGTGWTCPGTAANNCTRSDVLVAGAGYPAITVTVNVAATASSPQVNSVNVSGGGSASADSADPTTIASANARFVPLMPCRIADTRKSAGAFAGPSIGGGTSRDFIVPNSTCGVPSIAQAYSLNVAVVPSGPLGFLTVFPAGQTRPLASTLNSLDGRIKSSAVIAPAGTGGAVSVFASNTTDVVLDINGYFVPASDATALAFYPLTPCRIADTRKPAAPLGGPSLVGGQSRTFPIRSSMCSLPATAQAYSLNFAAVPGGPLGFVTAFPTGQTKPPTSNLNAPTGTVVANAAIVTAGTDGSIDVFASNHTDLVIDIDGYFAPKGTGGLSLYGVTPCRVVDTRKPPGSPPIIGLDVNLTSSSCGIPVTAQACVLSVTVVPPGPLGYLTLWPQGQTRPVVATLNAVDGAITSNMAIVPCPNGSISAFPSNPTHLILDILGYFGQ